MRVRSVAVMVVMIIVSGTMSVYAADSQPGSYVKNSAAETMKGKDGAPMVLIPAGPFTMGSNDGLPS